MTNDTKPNPFAVLLLIVLVAAFLFVLFIFLYPGTPFLPGSSPAQARATAQSELSTAVARTTPLSNEAIVAVEAMDDMTEQQSKALESIVMVAVSGDLSQTSIAWSSVCTGMIAPLTLIGAAALLFALRKKE